MTVVMTVYVHTTVLTEEWEEIEDEIAALLMKRGIDAHIDNPLTGNTTSTSSILERRLPLLKVERDEDEFNAYYDGGE